MRLLTKLVLYSTFVGWGITFIRGADVDPNSVGTSHDFDWNYVYPDRWPGICGIGFKQSPIDIANAQRDDKNQTLRIHYAKSFFNFKNDGKVIEILPENPSLHYITNVPVYDTDLFFLYRCDLHWGDAHSAHHSTTSSSSLTAHSVNQNIQLHAASSDSSSSSGSSSSSSKGSEHSIHGHFYAMEMQCIHYNSKYGSYYNALTKQDGLVIFVVLYEVGDESQELHPVFENVEKVAQVDSAALHITVDLEHAPAEKSDTLYYYYDGSLTRPDCNEVVKWIIPKYHRTVSEAQLTLIRAAKQSPTKPIGSNLRPVQTIYDHNLLSTFIDQAPESSSVCHSLSLVSFLFVLCFYLF